jgi:hypothetical protein
MPLKLQQVNRMMLQTGKAGNKQQKDRIITFDKNNSNNSIGLFSHPARKPLENDANYIPTSN